MRCSHKIDIVAHFKSSWQGSLMPLTARAGRGRQFKLGS
jgi:hypothetical protein